MKSFQTYFICIAIEICCYTFGFSQNYNEFQIKEQYDWLSDLVVSPDYLDDFGAYQCCHNGCPKPDLSCFLGDRTGDFLTSQLRMYHTTQDKAYLVKFINWCIKIQSLRNDRNNIGTFDCKDANCGEAVLGNQPGWMINCLNLYHDGRTIYPMAEYVYMVMHDADLSNIPLPQSLIDNTFGSFSTYGVFADWLGQQVDETLNWFIDNGYWDNDEGFKQCPDAVKGAASINQLAHMSATMLYRGLSFPPGQANSNPYLNYRIKANIVGNLYKGSVDMVRDKDCPQVGDIDIPEECISSDVFITNTDNNSYWWYDGWRGEKKKRFTCKYDKPRIKCHDYTEFIEDISHALITLSLPWAYYRTNYTGIFSVLDMTKWRNTFAKNVYDGAGNFHNDVNGEDDEGPVGTQINDLKFSALAWMPFYKFDIYDSSPELVYDIVMKFYKNNVKDVVFQQYNLDGMHYLGLSETVAAQWDMECPDLTLYNRDVVYDQDFFAKNDLIVAPQQYDDYNASGAHAYADPTSFTDDKFIIEDGVTVNMKAANKIILKSGFHAKEGSNFRAYIDPTIGCNGQKWSGSSSGQASAYEPPALPEEETEPTREEEPPIQRATNIVMFPNPTSGQFTLLLLSEEETGISVYVSDLLSNIVYQKENITSSHHTIDISSASKGIYFVKIVSDNDVSVEKIIHQ
ncbi:MAG: T9SS type A sorting domain-containing protein [Bacteroidota bacterium]